MTEREMTKTGFPAWLVNALVRMENRILVKDQHDIMDYIRDLLNESYALQARIAELETTLQEIHQHYDDVHGEEVNALNARIAELEEENAELEKTLR